MTGSNPLSELPTFIFIVSKTISHSVRVANWKKPDCSEKENPGTKSGLISERFFSGQIS